MENYSMLWAMLCFGHVHSSQAVAFASTWVSNKVPSYYVHVFSTLGLLRTYLFSDKWFRSCCGGLPTSQKWSVLLPELVLKWGGLDQSDPANCRLTANVTFLSKVLEHVIANQLIAYLDVNELMPPQQSGFCSNHSTETLQLLSDFYSAMDPSSPRWR